MEASTPWKVRQSSADHAAARGGSTWFGVGVELGLGLGLGLGLRLGLGLGLGLELGLGLGLGSVPEGVAEGALRDAVGTRVRPAGLSRPQ